MRILIFRRIVGLQNVVIAFKKLEGQYILIITKPFLKSKYIHEKKNL